MPDTINSTKAAASTLFLGHNGEWWDFSLIIAGIFVALAALAALIATAGSIVAHKREAAASEEALVKYKLDTAKDIAEAQERSAKIENENLSLRNELLKVDTKYSPRSLSSEGVKVLQHLAGKIDPICIISYGGSEPASYAEQISQALSAVNLVGDRITSETLGGTVGVSVNLGPLVKTQDEANRDPLVLALKDAKIIVGSMSWGTRSAAVLIPPSAPIQLRDTERVLIVGEKPLPTK